MPATCSTSGSGPRGCPASSTSCDAGGRVPVQTVDQAVERFGRLSESGIDTVILGMANDTQDEAYELVAEVVRQVEPLRAPGR